MENKRSKNIFVLGCGRWGSFIGWYLDNIGHKVTLYGRENSKNMKRFMETRQNDYITLSESIILTSNLEDIKQADFYDMAGKMVLTSSHNKIDVRKLDRGVYLVRVMLKNGTTSTQKIIIK